MNAAMLLTLIMYSRSTNTIETGTPANTMLTGITPEFYTPTTTFLMEILISIISFGIVLYLSISRDKVNGLQGKFLIVLGVVFGAYNFLFGIFLSMMPFGIKCIILLVLGVCVYFLSLNAWFSDLFMAISCGVYSGYLGNLLFTNRVSLLRMLLVCFFIIVSYIISKIWVGLVAKIARVSASAFYCLCIIYPVINIFEMCVEIAIHKLFLIILAKFVVVSCIVVSILLPSLISERKYDASEV